MPGFTGRQAEVEELVTAAQHPSNELVIRTIDGMPGAGKSALAVHVAHRLTDRFPDGQLFVRLHAHTPGQTAADPADALAAMLISIGVDPRSIPDGLDARAGMWRDRLTGKQMMLIMDDAIGHEQIEPLLPGAGGCMVLVTSRRRIAALDGAAPLPLGSLSRTDAALLFTRLSRRTATQAADTEAVAQIVELCGFLPLAIALLAGRFAHHPHWNLPEYAQEFSATHDRLGELAAGDRAVAAAFDMSYRALPPRRRRLFRYLGLHPGLDTDAYATAALGQISLPQARHELEALYDDHLIDSPSTGRYRLHDLIRAYARTLTVRNDPPEDRDAAQGRVLDYYQYTAETADDHFTPVPRPTLRTEGPAPTSVPAVAAYQPALAWMRAERANLTACIHHATATAQHVRAIRLTASLAAHLRHQGPWDEAIALHQSAAVTAHRTGERLGEANALSELSRVHHLVGNQTATADLAQQALELYRCLGNRLGEASALSQLGQVRYISGEYETAANLAQQALDLYRSLSNNYGEADALVSLGRARYMVGDYAAAGNLAQQALVLSHSFGEHLTKANALSDLGRVWDITSDYAAAADFSRQALDLYHTLGNRLGEANAMSHLGRTEYTIGRYAAAADHLQRAVDLYRTLGHRLGEANALSDLVRLQCRTGEHASAADLAHQALALARAVGNRHIEANALSDLGRVQYLIGEYAPAADLLQQAVMMFQEVGDPQGEAETLNTIGALLTETRHPREALPAYQRALQLARQVQSPLDEAHALEGAARCHVSAGDHHAGLAALGRAVDLYQRIGAAEAPAAAQYLAQLQTEH
ncbi:tetratricopeptide repeat protein [Streptomyces sp. NPDC002574]|uniref:tetratricopeptide repeat protein n=1 Tax=Streptomyces sp. NPDC002574 TaxID=3364652 RepID=UPI003694EC41